MLGVEINPWCGLCYAPQSDWRFEVAQIQRFKRAPDICGDVTRFTLPFGLLRDSSESRVVSD
jgi:hypothetical protein